MAVYLKDLYFGCADGDTEANEKDFLDLFYKGNNKYDEIVNNPLKFIIYGQKGTGKTILGRYIEKNFNAKGINCKILNKDDITLGKMIEKNSEILSSDEAIHLFKWIIYYKIYQIIRKINIHSKFQINIKRFIKDFKEVRVHKKNIRQLEDFFTKRYPKGNFEFLEYTTNSEENIDAQIESALDKAGEYVIKPSIKSTIKSEQKYSENKKYVKKEFFKAIEEVEEKIMICLKRVNVTIILDDLDELDIKFNTEDKSIIALNKLIEAFKSINICLVNKNLTNSKCLLLIRSDIIEELNKRSSNLNKIIRDNSVELYWIDKENIHPEKQMLMEMILNKIKRTCDEYKNIDNANLYKKLFPEQINDLSIINYMINNSFGRPRDIICFLDIVKQRYPEESCFRAVMLKECKQAYSDAFLKELYNEMRVHLDIETVEDYLNLIRNFGRNTFYLSDLKRYYRPRSSNYKYITSLNKCVEDLYKFGVLGNFKKIGDKDKKSYSYSWGYRKDGNPNANLEQKFSVHYGLRKILNTN